jgi:chemotaxis response regulator CheB
MGGTPTPALTFDGMPRSAVDTGTVDLVLGPEAMGPALDRYL